MQSIKGVLKHVPAYVLLQKVVGADRLRYRSIAALELKPGEVVLDVGCGPAYYFDKLPQPLTYHGFDTEPRYVEWATKKWGDRATFHLGIFDEARAAEMPPVDAILLLGLLHHLSDEECKALLQLSAGVLAPGGRVTAVDTCYSPGQGRVSKWMSDNDRGEFVRQPEAFVDLASTAFQDVEGEVVNDATRVPGSFWMMRMSSP